MFGMPITEPVTMLTDYMITGQGMLLAWYLLGSAGTIRNRSRRLWAWALVAIALASLFGGTYHGFLEILPGHLLPYLWTATTLSIGFASCLMVLGTVFATTQGKWRTTLVSISLVQLLVYTGWMMTHDDFIFVIINYAPSMILVLILQLIGLANRPTGSEVYFISAVVVSFVAAGVQQTGISLHPHVNHNDIYHLIQMISLYLFYRGALILQDVEATPSAT